MTMRVNIKDQYLDKFEDFISSLPNDAVEINTMEENSISLEDGQKKVQRAINNISKNEGINLDNAFGKVVNY
jgi:hypothetical protein